MNRTLVLAASAVLFAACSHDNNTPPNLPAGCDLPDPQPTALASSKVVELGIHQVGERLTFAVPPNTGSISIVEQASGDVPIPRSRTTRPASSSRAPASTRAT